jgi:hypothetical protein
MADAREEGGDEEKVLIVLGGRGRSALQMGLATMSSGHIRSRVLYSCP